MSLWHPPKKKAKRKRYFRVIRVLLECGCASDINTSRYRLQASVISMLLMTAARRGIWCIKCNAQCQPTSMVGVFRQ